MGNEYHLFIIWERARSKQQQIVADISKYFEIKCGYEMQWSGAKLHQNLRRFYRASLPSVRAKLAECGRGPFLMLAVIDKQPHYENRHTLNHGDIRVNVNTFDAKIRYRSWMGSQNSSVHATNNTQETSRDVIMLTGVDAERFFEEHAKVSWDGHFKPWQRDVVGADGWESLAQLLYVLNHTSLYVVLRNFDQLPNVANTTEHGDIDLLTVDPIDLRYICNAEPVFRKSYRVHHRVQVAGQPTLFDFRFVGDGYYDANWESRILEQRTQSARGFFIPSPEQHFYSLLYHAYIHKKRVSAEYRERLSSIWAALGRTPLDFNSAQPLQELWRYMEKHQYQFTRPRDRSVYYNRENVPTSQRPRATMRELFMGCLRRLRV